MELEVRRLLNAFSAGGILPPEAAELVQDYFYSPDTSAEEDSDLDEQATQQSLSVQQQRTQLPT